ncbi:toxin [Psychromonas sp. MB-3u-54]|uniref:SpvB/TcaC N-terminal domain-containing protein n=1 Tax=Psychromonas sp. MB-3u-54 TaxID=2058319 RepID=UPI000C33B069|nr:SpvB/TcaC N-terminal domain-containing protein [Psychromonas sp. MB-3u-54]PKH01306.1 toxin [Psychromonas sp. MB-3u-54]
MIKVAQPSLPKGGGAISGIGETFQPDAFTGTASLSIPIPTSSCRGFEPHLSIDYSSGSGNGIFGIGFNLAIPNISRKTAKAIPRYDDTDTFLISNADDLLLVSDSPKIPKDNAVGYSVFTYRPRTEGLFARVERWVKNENDDTHWRVTTKDNVTSIYGETGCARVTDVDPDNKTKTRIYQWLLERSFDAKGNQIVYTYQEDGANKHISSIKYGNYSPDTKPQSEDEWHFKVRFFYSKPATLGSLHEDNESESDRPRPDPFSSYKSGFNIRTTVRCTRISMHHRFDCENGGNSFEVSATEFDYLARENTSALTFLNAVKQVGYCDGTAKAQAMPPLQFDWSKSGMCADPSAVIVNALGFKSLKSEAGTSIVGFLEKGAQQIVDLYGEGLPGILYTDADSVLYSRPLGDGRYAASNAPHAFPIERNLQEGGLALMDLEGDGKLDLVVTTVSRSGYYESIRGGNWKPYHSFASTPTELHHPQRQMVDVTGDGLPDLLLFEGEAVKVYPSKGKLGYDGLYWQSTDSRLPVTSHSSKHEAIHFADPFGDGGSHLMRIRNGSVECWPNLGYGRFGPMVAIANAPLFAAEMDASRLFLTDIDGSGTTDLVYVYPDRVDIYRNESGNRFSKPISVTLPQPWDKISQISFADVLGNGTACLVFTSVNIDLSLNHQYYDFTAGTKPHLLTEVDNNMGATTLIHYSPSTKFYLADEQAGTPWITRLPFPVQVVEKIETLDHIGCTRLVASYSYHHGFFDPVEREFRGFGRVERQDAESFDLASQLEPGEAALAEPKDRSHDLPPILTKTWYHTGAYAEAKIISQQYAGEYYKGDDLASPLSDSTLDPQFNEYSERRIEAYRALHGHVLREEVYGLDHQQNPSLKNPELDQHPYTITESNFYVKLLQAKADQNDAVCLVHPRETISYHYERNPADPRVNHALTLQVDEYGNVLKESAISYGRRKDTYEALLLPVDHNKQRLIHMTCTENMFTHAIVDQADVYLAPLPAESCTYELRKAQQETSTNKATVLYSVNDILSFFTQAADGKYDVDYEDLHFDKAKRITAKDTGEGQKYFRRLIEHARILYRKNDLTALLPLGMLESLALPGESYQLAYTDELLEHVFKRKQTDHSGDASLLLGKGAAQGGYISKDGKGWVPSGRIFFDVDADIDEPANSAVDELDSARRHFFLPRKFVDPFAATSNVTYDDYDLLITETRDALDNVVKSDNDYRVLQPRLITDPNGNRTAVAIDALGMVVATAVMGKADQNVGDLLEGFDADPALSDLQAFIKDPQTSVLSLLGNASTRIVYDLTRFQRTGQPPFAATLARETHINDPAGIKMGIDCRIQTTFSYSDGFGREIQKKVRAEAGDAPQRMADVLLPTDDIHPGDLVRQTLDKPVHTSQRWVGTGRTVFNNKGKPVKQYEPFFSSTHLYEQESKMIDAGVTSIVFYDPLERVVATLHPNHSFEKVVFDPWRQESWDVNDTVMLSDPGTDPDVGQYFQLLATADYLPGWYDQRSNGQQGTDEQAAANKAAVHAATPTVTYSDTLGRPILTIADNGKDGKGEEQKYATRVVHDIEGNELELIDANGRIAMRYDYDMLGNCIHEASMDAGERWMLNDVAGKPLYAWDSRGHIFRTEYDPLRRPLRSFVTGADPANPKRKLLTERLIYGEQHPEAVRFNLRGQLYRHLDQAGVVTSEGHDFKGNLLCVSRRIAKDYKQTLDWSAIEKVIQFNASIPLDLFVREGAVTRLLEDDTYTSHTSYDALNRPTKLTAPDNSVIRHHYNAANLLERVEANLHSSKNKDKLVWTSFIKNIDYDAKGQRKRIDYANGASTAYVYDPLTFRLINLYTWRGAVFTDSDSDNKPAIEALDRPSQAKSCALQNLHYSYDPAGNITHIRDDAQQTVYFKNKRVEPNGNYTYDALYRLIEATGREHIGQIGGSPIPHSSNDSPRAGLPQPGDGNAMGVYAEHYEYDAEGNFLKMQHRGSDSAHPGWTRTYDCDETSLIEDGSSGTSRKTSNRLSSTTVGSNIRCEERFAYDAHGNITRMPHLGGANPGPNMHWDYRDQLRQSDLGGGRTVYYVYDASGQRVRQVTESYAGAGKTPVNRKERLYLGGFEIYRTYKNAGETAELERESLHIMDDEQRIALVETRTEGRDKAEKPLIRYQFGNHLGSASLELDESAQIISYEEYTPFGSTSYQAVRSQTDTAKRYRYSGKELDDSTGLYYYGARYYAPWLGRWMSPDPAGTVDGLNLYAFVSGNPIRFNDHTGLGKEDFHRLIELEGDRSTEQLVRGGRKRFPEKVALATRHIRNMTKELALGKSGRVKREFRNAAVALTAGVAGKFIPYSGAVIGLAADAKPSLQDQEKNANFKSMTKHPLQEAAKNPVKLAPGYEFGRALLQGVALASKSKKEINEMAFSEIEQTHSEVEDILENLERAKNKYGPDAEIHIRRGRLKLQKTRRVNRIWAKWDEAWKGYLNAAEEFKKGEESKGNTLLLGSHGISSSSAEPVPTLHHQSTGSGQRSSR